VRAAAATMERSAKVLVAALLVLAVAAEARNLKAMEPGKDDAVVQPQTFPPFDRLGGSGSSIPGFGSMPGGSSIPAFSGLPGTGSFGSMPLFGSPGLGGMPGSPAAGSVVAEPAKQP
jgi:hypothetical protein